MGSADSSDVVLVAPREIVDLVTRLLRVHGVDPGTAMATAADVMRCEAHGYPAVRRVLGRFATPDERSGDGESPEALEAPHARRPPDPTVMARAYRSGIPFDESTFRALERAAAAFLVAERVLDAIADDAPAE